MSYELHIEDRPGYMYVRIDGQNSRETIPQYMSQVVRECTVRDCFRVLIHECLDGPRLEPMDVFAIASEGSLDALGVFEAVAYVDEKMGDTRDFAETVAVNRGMPIAMFSRLSKAERWIIERKGGNQEQDVFLEEPQD